jgi:hypothetical protein
MKMFHNDKEILHRSKDEMQEGKKKGGGGKHEKGNKSTFSYLISFP